METGEGFEQPGSHDKAEKWQPGHRNWAGSCFVFLSFFPLPLIQLNMCVSRVKLTSLRSSNVFNVVAKGNVKLWLCNFSKLKV